MAERDVGGNPGAGQRRDSASLEGVRSASEWGRRALGRRLRRVALAAAEAFLCDRDARGGVAPPDPERCRRVVDDFELTVGAGSPPVRLGVSALLVATELLPVLVIGRRRRMSRLPLAERVRYLQALEEHPLGLLSTLLAGVKIPMTLSAFEEGEGLRMTGFDRRSTAATERAGAADGAVGGSGGPGPSEGQPQAEEPS